MSLDNISEEQAESILDRLARRVGHESIGVAFDKCLCLMDNLKATPTALVVKDGLETVPCRLLSLDITSMDGSPRLFSMLILETILGTSRSGCSIVFYAPSPTALQQSWQQSWQTIEFLPADMTLEKLLIMLDLKGIA